MAYFLQKALRKYLDRMVVKVLVKEYTVQKAGEA